MKKLTGKWGVYASKYEWNIIVGLDFHGVS